ncbi:uncharacterized protein LOC117179181 [Belonocnema kinseyi]|uniref:uncharacterized protein LOC117179181 n=1 Tax=Belonocnema kinseyi TaxID=2817044 RepID=UPI00143DDCC8|nr:uncharacterized protein LOC117179181 [Belonocnema kinseyi]
MMHMTNHAVHLDTELSKSEEDPEVVEEQKRTARRQSFRSHPYSGSPNGYQQRYSNNGLTDGPVLNGPVPNSHPQNGQNVNRLGIVRGQRMRTLDRLPNFHMGRRRYTNPEEYN